LAGTRRFSKPYERLTERAEKSALLGALDAYEAIRLTPGPERAAAERAIKALISPYGFVVHEGRVYHWSREDDSLVRHLSRRTWRTPQTGDVDGVRVRRRGTTLGDGDEGRRLWHGCIRGRAI